MYFRNEQQSFREHFIECIGYRLIVYLIFATRTCGHAVLLALRAKPIGIHVEQLPAVAVPILSVAAVCAESAENVHANYTY